MKEYIHKITEEFTYMEEVKSIKSVKNPAEEQLFTVKTNEKNMYTQKTDVSHTTIDKELFLCKGTRPNIQPTVPFVCTRFKVSDEDDWKKLLIMIKYLQETRDYELKLKINNMTITDWYSHADFSVHANIKSHMVGLLTMGKGAALTISMKQKINIKISTEV